MSSRFTLSDIAAHKGKEPLAVLTAYTAPSARLMDPYVDILLVGDSLGMVLYGMENTRGVTLDMMIAHGRAVVNASQRALVVVDMPYGSYQLSPEEALVNSQRVIKETGADALKLEGGVELAETVRYLIQQGVPVMGHVGLMPQRVIEAKGYRYQGRTEEEAKLIEDDAAAIEAAGAFSLVIEAVKEDVARRITQQLRIPTIGIGASVACDGQVLVSEDMLGLSARSPGFVKKYAQLDEAITAAAKAYSAEVKSRAFPTDAHVFTGKKKS